MSTASGIFKLGSSISFPYFGYQGPKLIITLHAFVATARRVTDGEQPLYDVVSHDGLPVFCNAQIPRVFLRLRPEDRKLALCLLISGRDGAILAARRLAFGSRAVRWPAERVYNDWIFD